MAAVPSDYDPQQMRRCSQRTSCRQTVRIASSPPSVRRRAAAGGAAPAREAPQSRPSPVCGRRLARPGPGRGLQSLRGRGLENTRAGRPQGCMFGCVSLKLPSRPAAVSLCEGHAAPEGVSLWKSRLPLTRRRLPREAPPSRRPQALGAAHVQLRRPELPEAPARPAQGPALGRAREREQSPCGFAESPGKAPPPPTPGPSITFPISTPESGPADEDSRPGPRGLGPASSPQDSPAAGSAGWGAGPRRCPVWNHPACPSVL